MKKALNFIWSIILMVLGLLLFVHDKVLLIAMPWKDSYSFYKYGNVRYKQAEKALLDGSLPPEEFIEDDYSFVLDEALNRFFIVLTLAIIVGSVWLNVVWFPS